MEYVVLLKQNLLCYTTFMKNPSADGAFLFEFFFCLGERESKSVKSQMQKPSTHTPF